MDGGSVETFLVYLVPAEISHVLGRSPDSYRDLKPENVLLGKDGYICLTDFGPPLALTHRSQLRKPAPCSKQACAALAAPFSRWPLVRRPFEGGRQRRCGRCPALLPQHNTPVAHPRPRPHSAFPLPLRQPAAVCVGAAAVCVGAAGLVSSCRRSLVTEDDAVAFVAEPP